MSYPDIEHVKMMSDSCGGQQKIFSFSAMCQYAVNSHPNLKTIDHVYFEPGHSHMECDSVHSKIKVKSKNSPVYTLEGWAQIIRLARTKPSPFEVTQLLHDDFLNFNQRRATFAMENKIKPKKKQRKNEKENEVHEEQGSYGDTNFKYSDGVWYQYQKNENKNIFMKTSIDGNFITLVTKQQKGKQNTNPVNPYEERLPITDVKKTSYHYVHKI